MGKVKYKDLPASFENMVAPSAINKSRSSVGMEHAIGEYYFIALEKLRPYSKQARKLIDDGELDGLAQSIKQYGIRQPLSVIRYNNTEFEVISGERRMCAAKLAGLEKVPCIILDEAKDAEEIALIENIQRKDLHPLEVTEAIISLDTKITHGDKQILADKLGISRSKFSEYLSYVAIPQEVRANLIVNNVRNRDTLRSLAANPESSLEMMDGVTSSKTGKLPSAFSRTKSILRIYYNQGELIVQKKSIKLLALKEKEALRQALNTVLKDIE